MKFYYTPGACSLGSHIALEWSGADYQAESVPFADERLKEIYPEGNGKVPILDRENGLPPLTQSPAILRYIADRYPGAEIGSSDSIDLFFIQCLSLSVIPMIIAKPLLSQLQRQLEC